MHSTLRTFCLAMVVASVFAAPSARGQDGYIPLQADRVAELAASLLPPQRFAGPTIDDRHTWDSLARSERYGNLLKRAAELKSAPPNELTREMYEAYSRGGRRGAYDRPRQENRFRLGSFVLAECLENRGEHIPAIETYLRAACEELPWVSPAHDPRMENLRGETVEVDLSSAATAWHLAVTLHLLGERLDPAVVAQVRSEIDRRVWTPFLEMVRGKRELCWWLTEKANNWNAVCLAGVVGSALTLEPSSARRGEIVEAARAYVPHFLNSFERDGYCSEGVGYWNYGYGHFIMLSDVVYRATGGTLDLLADARAQRAAVFPRRIRMATGAYPAFADCPPGARPVERFVEYLDSRLARRSQPPERMERFRPHSLYETMIFAFDNAASNPTRLLVSDLAVDGLRSWFPVAGVLVTRPAAAGKMTLSAAVKGGHNDEEHNHNDVGTYAVAVGDTVVLADPGSEVYTARTFSSERYESKVLNSFGHPVPRPADTLQSTGRDARASVLATEFADAADRVAFDLTAAYDLPEMTSLTRRFEHSRAGTGTVTITDEVVFAAPAAFETALVTFGSMRRDGDELLVAEKDRAVRVTIDTGGIGYEIAQEVLDEELPRGRQPTRIAIRLTQPVIRAAIRVTICPAPQPASAPATDE